MRAVVVTDDRGLEVRELADPEPGAGEVTVRVEACGICGSDLHMLPSESLPIGSVMGHEFSGLVERVGEDVAGWEGGERVCVYPFKPLDHHDLLAAMGSGLGLGENPGAYAELVSCPSEMLWRLPDGMALEHGALVEPLAVALHGVDIAGVCPGDSCCVLGCGPIGAMVITALRARGIERVVAVEPNPKRRAAAQRLGASSASGLEGVHEAVIAALGEPPAFVFECAGHPSAPGLAIELVAPEGIVALLGVLEEPVEISQLNLMVKEAQVRACFAYRPANFDEAVALIAAGKVAAEELISASVPLERAGEMFAELTAPGTEQLKVLLRPGS